MIARLRFQIRLVCALSCLFGTIPGIVWGASLEGGVKWQEEEGYAWAKLRDAGRGGEGFKLLSVRSTGLSFTNTLPERRHLTNQILLNGAGVAAGDVDGDGWCDIYLCCSDGENALFRNLGGWKFERVVGAGGAGCAGLTSTGATLLDLDGDGDLDLVVNTLGNGTRVLVNDGSGRFSPAGGELNAGAGGMTTAAADFDGDGDLDLYISNYRTSGLMDIPNARATFARVDGRMVMESLNGVSTTDPALTNRFVVGERGDIQELGEPDLLLRNEGGMRFVPVSFTGGAFLDEAGEVLREVPRDWGLCAAFRDLNGDGLPDLYVCNDFQTEDRLWVNRGGGRFQAVGALG
ncbi:MAG: FG-GAP repeat domain-containing protein, partial [Limisphaerales bacterium]